MSRLVASIRKVQSDRKFKKSFEKTESRLFAEAADSSLNAVLDRNTAEMELHEECYISPR